MTDAQQDAGGFEVVSSERRFDGAVFDVRTDEVRMPDGSVAKRDVIDHPGAVGIVALDAENNVVLVRQYRHPVGHELLELPAGLLLELPAGLLDVDGESALLAAQRELAEETALVAEQWSVLVDLHTSPGMSDEAIRIFLARGLSDATADDRFSPEDEEASMTVERRPLDEVAGLALAGELTNGPAVAGVLAARLAGAAGWAGLRPADAPWQARPDRVPAAG